MLSSLNVAQSGLRVSKIAVENVSNNIANENTPGYKRRVVPINEMNINDSRSTGRGVVTSDAYRITSEYIFNNIMRENTRSNYYDEISLIVGNIEKMFNETETSGFSKELNRFFQTVENLRSNPSSEVYKAALKTEGTSLVNSLKGLYTAIEEQENITKNRLADNVTEINSLLNKIGKVNEQLGQQNASANDLLDKRDNLEKDLSKLVNITVDRRDGDYELKIGGETAVRYSNIREVNLVEKKTAQIDRYATNPTTGIPKDLITDQIGTVVKGTTVTYKLDNDHSVTIEVGSNQYTDSQGNKHNIDIDGDNNADTVTEDNIVRALVASINSNFNMANKVRAFNGNYTLDNNDKKIDNIINDKFLVVEAKKEGIDGKFSGRIIYNNPTHGVSGITSNQVVDSDLSKAVTKDEHIIINGNKIKTYGEDFDSLATAINKIGSPFVPTTYDANKKELSINGISTPFSTGGKSYADLISTINADGTYTSSKGNPITINGKTFVTAGEDFASLATEINNHGSFNASYNGSNQLTINGQNFALSSSTTYKDLATSLNSNANFTSHTEVRGDISITVGGGVKTFYVTDTTTYQNLADSINADENLSARISADGKLVIQDAKSHSNPLIITENIPTKIGISKFDSRSNNLYRTEQQSVNAKDKTFLALYDSEVKLSSGQVKAQVENLNTDNSNNKLTNYKNKLDSFARTISDLYEKYVETSDDKYLYGQVSSDDYEGSKTIKNINLFDGFDVKSLKFNEDSVDSLTQKDLDYVGQIQWKKDFDFDGKEQDGSTVEKSSLSEFFQELRVNISSDKENNDFFHKTQKVVVQSLESSYDQLTKVDKDKEMIDLIKFQAAYSANAKIITVVDEMLNTLLNLKR